ncbi:MAG TPA: 50S ribosomal protein L18 [Thermodesulfobacteriaceae bacterium]|nr:50S ribosomal protein L18 [Thermodesulfobacteriaceae bacterium]
MGKTSSKHSVRIRRRKHIRKSLSGTSERPRLAVFRSNRHIYAQIVDDEAGRTLMSVSSVTPEIREKTGEMEGKTAVAREVGSLLARKARDKGITTVAFDRGGFLFHGRVKALADAAREVGLKF